MKYSILIYILVVLNFNGVSQNNRIYYDHIYPFREGFSLVVLDGKFGIINTKFEEVIPPILTSINNFDLSNYYFDNLLYGVIQDSTILFDTKGKRVKAFNDPEIYPFRNFINEKIDSLYITGTFSSLGCEKEDHTVVIPYEYNYINKGLKNHILAIKNIKQYNVSADDDINVIRSRETVIYNFKGDTIYKLDGAIQFWKSAGIYFLEEKVGFVPTNSELKILNNNIYERVRPTKNSLCWVLTEQGWGLINSSFKYIIEPQFSSIYSNSTWTAVKKGNKYGFVNSLGVQVTEIEYDSDWTQYVSNDSIIVAYKKDHPIFLNTSGTCIYNCAPKDTINKKYTSGRTQVNGLFKNNMKIDTWYYYRDDNENSITKTIIYTDSINTYTTFNEQGKILETWIEKNKYVR